MITYENGKKVHVRPLKASRIMRATEIVPGTVYLGKNGAHGYWEPILINTTKEPGWLRGHCDIRGFTTRLRFVAYVTVKNVLNDVSWDMKVSRLQFGDEWSFEDERKGTLMPLPNGFIDTEIYKLEHAINVKRVEIDNLSHRIEQLRAMFV